MGLVATLLTVSSIIAADTYAFLGGKVDTTFSLMLIVFFFYHKEFRHKFKISIVLVGFFSMISIMLSFFFFLSLSGCHIVCSLALYIMRIHRLKFNNHWKYKLIAMYVQ